MSAMNAIVKLPQISRATAIAWAGGSQSHLARHLGVTDSAVSLWFAKDGPGIPEGRLWQLVAMGCPQDADDAADAKQ